MQGAHRVATLVLIMTLAGCGERASTSDPASVIVTDSASVRIVDNGDVDPRTLGFVLDPEPLFSVGWSEHPDSLQFRTLRQGAISRSGNFVVADLDQVFVLRPDGSLVYSVGGAGDGPGEFQSIWQLVPGFGDTLLVHDWGRNRVATFVGRELVSDLRLPDHDRIDRNVVHGRNNGALILPPTGYFPNDGPPTEWYAAPTLRMEAGVVDTVISLDFSRKGRNHLLSPLGWVRVSGDQLVHSKGDEHVVRWYNFEGELNQVSRWSSPWVEATDSVWARLSDGLREIRPYSEMPEHEYLERLEGWRATAVGPLPTYSSLHGDPVGGAWLSEYGPSTVLPTEYSYIDNEGVFSGAIRLPEGFEVLAFGGDVVLGVVRNEFGVSAAVAYRFSRAP